MWLYWLIYIKEHEKRIVYFLARFALESKAVHCPTYLHAVLYIVQPISVLGYTLPNLSPCWVIHCPTFLRAGLYIAQPISVLGYC